MQFEINGHTYSTGKLGVQQLSEVANLIVKLIPDGEDISRLTIIKSLFSENLLTYSLALMVHEDNHTWKITDIPNIQKDIYDGNLDFDVMNEVVEDFLSRNHNLNLLLRKPLSSVFPILKTPKEQVEMLTIETESD
jgi:hypothetical protein